MTKLTKRAKLIKAKVDRTKPYPFDNAIALVKELATAKFNESIDVAVQLGVDAKKIRPGRSWFCGAASRYRQNDAGGCIRHWREGRRSKGSGCRHCWHGRSGGIHQGRQHAFDVVIASPDTMRIVGTLGQVLGPRGLMPNPKVGTVTPDVATAVKNAKAGQVQYRTDKAGIVHATIGRKSFADADLKTNLLALLDALNKAKPASSKGVYLRKVSLSSTMGAGVRVDQTTLSA